MTIQCPYCQHLLQLKGTRPGRYGPRCPACQKRFALVVPEAGKPPIVAAVGIRDEDALPPSVALALGIEAPAARSAVRPALHAGASMAGQKAAVAQTVAPPPANGDRRTLVPGQLDRGYETPAPHPGPAETQADDLKATQPPKTQPPKTQPPSAEPAQDEPAWPGVAPAARTMLSSLDQKILGGYQLLQRLGQGGMGAVYLAKQLSLDRNVAVKVLHPRWAGDPQFVARFTREAFAAAQLVHHNVVQIHDIGAQERTNFYSMEYVEGQNLADVLKRDGKLEPQVAVTLILQAARGLKFAHDRGMIHRDIKPENLMLNAEGIVKVADLGLVKTAGALEPAGQGGAMHDAARSSSAVLRSHQTDVKVAMGTPMYMPPEQAKDAANVDARADIYSLGCTLYCLLTGQPPFTGRTSADLARKHASERPLPPSQRVKRVPGELSDMVLKMIAKKPEERYQNLGEVIAALESFLGVSSTGPQSAGEEQITALEDAATRFANASWAILRPKLIIGYVLFCLLMVAWFTLNTQWALAGAFAGAAVLTGVAYFLLSGLLERTYLFRKVRQWAFSASWRDWVNVALVAAVAIAFLAAFGWLWAWLMVLLLSILVAAGFCLIVDRRLDEQRKIPLDRAESVLKKLRQRGLEETAVRQAVCRYGGDNWEEFYEALFGYEAKIEARQRWGVNERGQARRKFRPWRDPIIRWIDARERRRQEARLQRHLQAVETRSLEAGGLDAIAARQKARRRAEAMIAHATDVRQTLAQTAAEDQAAAQTLSFERIFDASGEPQEAVVRRHHFYLTRRYGGPLDILLGRQARFVLAVILLAFFLTWRVQNPTFTRDLAETVSAKTQDATVTARDLRGSAWEVQRAFHAARDADRPLELSWLPQSLANVLGTWNAGAAGLILLFTALFHGRALALLVYIAAAVALAGQWLGDATAVAGRLHLTSPQAAAMLAGAALATIAVFFFREPDA